jgi:hypothetical protein
MTTVTQFLDYLETPYLEFSYLGEAAIGSTGMQATFTIEDDAPVGVQTEFSISPSNSTGFQITTGLFIHILCKGYLVDDYLSGPYLSADGAYCVVGGVQAEFSIVDFESPLGFQALVGTEVFTGTQTTFEIDDDNPIGVQTEFNIVDSLNPLGIQVLAGTVDKLSPLGVQTEFNIVDSLNNTGVQTEFNIVDFLNNTGIQSEFNIEDFLNATGMQTTFSIVDFLNNTGMQIDVIVENYVGMQFRSVIYSATAFRTMCEFPSRGTVVNNWSSTSTEPLFSVNSVNTDIVEEVWRSASSVKTGIILTCDTGLVQGVAMDTLAILNTNITTSATVTVEASNDAGFGTIERSITLVPLPNGNMYHINAGVEFTSQRYWRVNIDDPTNPEDYLQIGLIVFGTGDIVINECFTDSIQFEQRDFTKTVRTEGQTTVAISRSQKRRVSLDFQSLLVGGGNYELFRNIFETYRTTLKCLWIPTPDPTDQTITDRYAVFSKLSSVPIESHNNKGPTTIYVSFTIDLDESL